MAANYCQLWLTCENTVEADTIAQALLDAKLIVCAKQTTVDSNFLWKGQKTNNQEVLLVMESRLDLFDEVEAVIAKLHSYDIFVLEAVPVVAVSKGAAGWLKKELKANG